MNHPHPSTDTPLLEAQDLTVTFGDNEVVHGINFSIKPGEVVALVGESGSGKSVSAMSAMRLLPEPPAHYPHGQYLWRGKTY